MIIFPSSLWVSARVAGRWPMSRTQEFWIDASPDP